MTISDFVIGGRKIATTLSTYCIAELSANHNQSLVQAVALVRAAKDAGADAVKLQTYTADTLTIACDSPLFRHDSDSLWANRTLYDLYQEAYTPWEWHLPLQEVAQQIGIDFFSTPFDPTAVDFLEKLAVPAYKIASFELVDIPLVRRIAQTGKPIIMSTGMATLDEITEAVRTIQEAGNQQIALLKCTSAYPAPPEAMNLRTIPHLAETFGVPVGLSDHTLGTTVPVVAVTLGASIVEKHFTLSRAAPGPDSAFSLEPHEFKAMVEAIREAEKSLGRVSYEVTEQEAASRAFRRSLFVVQDVEAGEIFSETNIRSIRPGHGLPPKYLDTILGKAATRSLTRGTPLAWDMVEGHGPT